MMISVKDAIRKIIEFAREFIKSYETSTASDTVDAILINGIKYAAFFGYGAKVYIGMNDLHNSDEISIRIMYKHCDVPVDTSYIPYKLTIGSNTFVDHDDPIKKVEETIASNGYAADMKLSKGIIIRVLSDFVKFVKEK